MRFNGYQKKYWQMALFLIVFVFLFLPGCSRTDKGDAPKKGEAPVPAKVEAPAKAETPAKVQEPARTQEPAKTPAPAKAPGDAKKPLMKPAAGAGGQQSEHNPDYDP